jgi:hypothetical protein
MARAKQRRNRYAEDNGEIENEIENGEEMEAAEDGTEAVEHAAHEAADMGRQVIRRIQHGAVDSFDVFSTPMARLMDQNWSIFQRMMHVMREESLHFMNRRLEQTSHAIESSKECSGIPGLLAVQQEWMVNFARDYAEQTKRFAEAMRDLAGDETSNLSQAATDVAERGRNAVEEEPRHAA